MKKEWQELLKLTGNKEIIVEKVRFREDNIAIEGEFELPPLAKLSTDDQIFVMAFIQYHGSIKRMEKAFGVSYPTIKNRLNRITKQLDLVQVETSPLAMDILEQLDKGEISVNEALKNIKDRKN